MVAYSWYSIIKCTTDEKVKTNVAYFAIREANCRYPPTDGRERRKMDVVTIFRIYLLKVYQFVLK